MFWLAKMHSKLAAPPVPPPIPAGFAPQLTNLSDDEHHAENVAEESDLFGQSFGMVYRAADDTVSQRRITVRALARSRDHHLVLRCFCWEREAARTFRVDRIETLYGLCSGEIIDGPVQFFERYAVSIGDVNAQAMLLKETSPGLRALLFLSRCDGDELIDEREAMWWYIDQRARGEAVNREPFEAFLNGQHPDAYLAVRGVRAIAKDDAHARCLLAAAAKLIAADGVIVENETVAYAELEELLHMVMFES